MPATIAPAMPQFDTDTTPRGPRQASTAALPLRAFLRFTDAGFERRFIANYVAFYRRYAQVSLVLGMLLIVGDWLVDLFAHGGSAANQLRLTLAVPVPVAGLAWSLLPNARRHWQPVMASFIVTVAICLFQILIRIDAEGGHGIGSWVGVLNFTFLEFYCFIILGVQWRHALAAGAAILAAFLHALWTRMGMPAPQSAYWSYHAVTLFVLAAGLPEQLDELLARYRLHASSLMLELTETMVMRDVGTAVEVLNRLRERGFALSLDDFGTGYSSLSHLRRLPMNELKIDRAFIVDVARGGRDGALAAAIVTLGSELGLQVVAEGVETEEQSQFLLGRGCVLQQGFLFSRPVPRDAFEELLATRALA